MLTPVTGKNKREEHMIVDVLISAPEEVLA
jgi:hypothetical protein